jgi:hypothetical protein
VQNLYVAGSSGSSTGSSGSKAVVWGLIVGDQMKDLLPGKTMPSFDGEQIEQIEAEKKRVMAPLNVTDGVDALELEDYVRNINTNYINVYKVELAKRAYSFQDCPER